MLTLTRALSNHSPMHFRGSPVFELCRFHASRIRFQRASVMEIESAQPCRLHPFDLKGRLELGKQN
jgi:hypothetical protein